MFIHRKFARQWLKNSSRADYDACTFDAKLTPAQKQIIDMYILDKLPVREIATRLSFCDSLIRRRLAEVFDKVAFL